VVGFVMPIVVAQHIERLYVYNNFSEYVNDVHFLLGISEVVRKYRHMLSSQTRLRVYFSRIFNEECEVVSEPRRFMLTNLVNATKYDDKERMGYRQADGYYVNMDDIADELSIPDGYFVEVLFVSLLIRKYGEKVIFPYETKTYTSKEIEDKVRERIEILSKIGTVSQSHSLLAEVGLEDIADELSIGYSRFQIGDYDGAIKSYRKVAEGFRNFLVQKEEKEGKKVFKKLIDGSESRTEKVVDFLNKTFSLLSNFGEHYGTHAFEEEGVFANKLVEDLAEYLTKKLRQVNATGLLVNQKNGQI